MWAVLLGFMTVGSAGGSRSFSSGAALGSLSCWAHSPEA